MVYDFGLGYPCSVDACSVFQLAWWKTYYHLENVTANITQWNCTEKAPVTQHMWVMIAHHSSRLRLTAVVRLAPFLCRCSKLWHEHFRQ